MNVYCIACPKCKWKMERIAPNTYPIKGNYRAPKCEWCQFQTRECDRKLSSEQRFHTSFSNKILQALTTIGEYYEDNT